MKKVQVVPVPIVLPTGHKNLRVVVISDTHNDTNQLRFSVPDGDILIHCGDFTERRDWIGLEEKLPETVSQFNDFMSSLPHKHKIVVAGNF